MNNVSFSIQRREGPRQLSMIVPKLCIWENHPFTCLGSSWEDFGLEDCFSLSISVLEYMPFVWRKKWKAIFTIPRGSAESTTPAVKSSNISPMLLWPLNWVNTDSLFWKLHFCVLDIRSAGWKIYFYLKKWSVNSKIRFLKLEEVDMQV